MQETNVSPRTCRSCGELKPIEDFDRRADSGGHHSLCKSCRRDYQRERWRRAHPPKPPAIARVIGSAEEFTCTRCGGIKPAEAFALRRHGRPELQWWCRECFSEIHATQYVEHREREVGRAIRNKGRRLREVRGRIIEYLAAHPCIDCGETDPLLLEFDHVRDKVIDVTTLAWRGAPWPEVQAEIEKCEIRCGKCHRRRTAQQRRQRREAIQAEVQSERVDKASTSRPRQLALVFGVRTCAGCRLVKPSVDFRPRSPDGARVESRCRPCSAAYQRDWYQRNRLDVMRRVRRNQQETIAMLRREVRAYLLAHPCTDCGEDDPDVLDFDHLRDKVGEVSTMVRRGWSWPTILEEIAKCEVVCANCHKRRTYQRRKALQGPVNPAPD